MSQNSHKKTLLFLLSLSICSFYLAAKPAKALTVSPPRIDELRAAPGQTLEFEIKLNNESEEAQTFEALSQNFQARDESGTPEFLNDKTDLALWLKLPDPLSLEPKQIKKVKLSITVPQNAEPGGYNAAVLFKKYEENQQQSEGINLSGGTGSLLLLTVTGELSEQGGILEFNTKNPTKWYTHLPIEFYYRFQNSGNINTRPLGTLGIYNTIGRNIQNISVNPEKNNVLKNSIRKFEITWQRILNLPDQKPVPAPPPSNTKYWTMVKYQWDNYAFGLYTAKLALAYGSDPIKYSFSETKFFVFPWQLLSFVSFILILTLLSFTLFLKTYNKWLLNSKITKPKPENLHNSEQNY